MHCTCRHLYLVAKHHRVFAHLQELLEAFDNEVVPGERTYSPPLRRGVLITACQAHEGSADLVPGGDLSKACGALTNAVDIVLRRLKAGPSEKPVRASTRDQRSE
jgi:hypothetical protein